MYMWFMKLAALAILTLTVLTQPAQTATLDDYYLQQFGEQTGSAQKSTFSTDDHGEVRCGMPLVQNLRRDWHQLQPSTQQVLAKQLSAPVLANEETLLSIAGHFRIHYATMGSDAPTPASPETVSSWVAKVADSFESALSRYQGLGYHVSPGTTYDVYLRSLAAQKIYGRTTSTSAAPSADFPNAYGSYIEIDKDFTDIIYTRLTPLQNLQITSSHEFHHAIQFGYNVFFDIWYAEATSTYYEAILYPSISQNYGYVPAWFNNSTKRIDLAVDVNAVSTGAGYGRWIFNRYLAEQYSPGILLTFWQNLASLSPDASGHVPMLPVINTALSGNLPTDFLNFARRVYLQKEWTLAADQNNINLSYRPISPYYSSYPVNSLSTPAPNATLEPYSFVYYKFVPTTFSGSSSMTITVNRTPAIAARAFRKDSAGNITEFTFSNTYPSSETINVISAEEIVLLLVNTSGDSTQNANFSTDGTTQDTTSTTPPPDTTPSGTSSGGSGGCFIATAAYGSYLHPQVRILREFRDNRLLTNAPGRAFVAWYYRISPPIAAFIAQHATLRLLARLLLTPIVLAIAHPATAGALLLAATCGIVGRLRMRKPIHDVRQDLAV